MNKQERNIKKMLKYKKRLKQLGLKEGENCKFYSYRSHGKPCSCCMCRNNKYRNERSSKVNRIWTKLPA